MSLLSFSHLIKLSETKDSLLKLMQYSTLFLSSISPYITDNNKSNKSIKKLSKLFSESRRSYDLFTFLPSLNSLVLSYKLNKSLFFADNKANLINCVGLILNDVDFLYGKLGKNRRKKIFFDVVANSFWLFYIVNEAKNKYAEIIEKRKGKKCGKNCMCVFVKELELANTLLDLPIAVNYLKIPKLVFGRNISNFFISLC